MREKEVEEEGGRAERQVERQRERAGRGRAV